MRITNVEAKAFDLELDRQTGQMQRARADLDHERMREQADVFLAALGITSRVRLREALEARGLT